MICQKTRLRSTPHTGQRNKCLIPSIWSHKRLPQFSLTLSKISFPREAKRYLCFRFLISFAECRWFRATNISSWFGIAWLIASATAMISAREHGFWLPWICTLLRIQVSAKLNSGAFADPRAIWNCSGCKSSRLPILMIWFSFTNSWSELLRVWRVIFSEMVLQESIPKRTLSFPHIY